MHRLRGGKVYRLSHSGNGTGCCFVLLVPTLLVYRVPRVSPGVTAPKLFSPTSVAGYAGPSSSYQTTPESPVLLSEVSGVHRRSVIANEKCYDSTNVCRGGYLFTIFVGVISNGTSLEHFVPNGTLTSQLFLMGLPLVNMRIIGSH